MLFPDLSAPEFSAKRAKTQGPAIAFVADRFLALVLDFLIFSPVVSLLLAGLVKKAKTYFLLDAQSPEGFVAGLLVFLAGAFVIILLQSVFLYYWQATPGHYFLQMRVRSYPQENSRLSFSQCLIRSLGFVGSFLLAGLPFLEVLSHPLRRAFHERASDTLVVTLKKVSDEGPEELEQRFISSWLRMSFLIFALFAIVGSLKTYQSLHTGGYQVQVPAGAQCREIADHELQGPARLDAALTLFMLDEISVECLHKEASASLWGDPVNSQELAYLAMYLIADKSEQQAYYERICRDRTSSSCLLAQYLLEGGESRLLKSADQKLWLTQVLQMESQYEEHNYAASLESIDKLQKIPALKTAMEKKYIRSIWALQQSSNHKSGRLPASVGKKSWLNEFKDRYGIE